ncbi:hypothetical protein BDW62DRAFT_205214 [Aspergillus aurantiobrunneus]
MSTVTKLRYLQGSLDAKKANYLAAGLAIALREFTKGSPFHLFCGYLSAAPNGQTVDEWCLSFCVIAPANAREGWKEDMLSELQKGKLGVEVDSDGNLLPRAVSDSNSSKPWMNVHLASILNEVSSMRVIDGFMDWLGVQFVSEGALLEQDTCILVYDDIPFWISREGSKISSDYATFQKLKHYIEAGDNESVARLEKTLSPSPIQRWEEIAAVVEAGQP